MGEPGRSHTETVLLEGWLWRELGQLGSRVRKPDSPNIKREADPGAHIKKALHFVTKSLFAELRR